MTDDEMMLWRFVIENFRCLPRHLKRSCTAVEWQKILIVHKKELLGVDRRDVGIAKAAAAIVGCLSGKPVDLEPLLPVTLWEKPQPTDEDLEALLDSVAFG